MEKTSWTYTVYPLNLVINITKLSVTKLVVAKLSDVKLSITKLSVAKTASTNIRPLFGTMFITFILSTNFIFLEIFIFQKKTCPRCWNIQVFCFTWNQSKHDKGGDVCPCPTYSRLPVVLITYCSSGSCLMVPSLFSQPSIIRSARTMRSEHLSSVAVDGKLSTFSMIIISLKMLHSHSSQLLDALNGFFFTLVTIFRTK